MVFRRHAQARRLVLRLNASGTGVLVTVPNGVSRAQGAGIHRTLARAGSRSVCRSRGGLIRLEPGHALPLPRHSAMTSAMSTAGAAW